MRNQKSRSEVARRQHRTLAGVLAALVFASLTLAAPHLSADKDQKRRNAPAAKSLKGLPITELTEDEAVLHALDRLGFGPRLGDMDRVKQMGLQKWIEQQLDPDKINDSAVQAKLERFSTLTMSSGQLLQEFPQPKQAAQQQGLSREQLQQLKEERQKMREVRQRSAGTPQSSDPNLQDVGKSMVPESGQAAQLGGKQQGFAGGDPNNPPMRLEDVRTPQRVVAELAMAKMTRAIYSERQLYEEMVDFWFNHFNVYAAKGADRWLLTSYERDVIRPHALGKFKDLLFATAKSPAMLFYLDNWQSADPKAFERMERDLAERRQRFYGLDGMRGPLRMDQFGRMGRRFPQQRPPQGPAGQPAQQQQQRRQRGLNENYARELMELHTLGVDGGYTQGDVIEVGKCFTGWTMRAPRRDPEFYFEDRIHDPGTKTVLGQKIHGGGMRDGENVLEMLARHPKTAKFISTKLARRFVSDNPPSALVERMSKKFLDTDGDIRAVLKTMLESPEFWSRETYRAKIKKPFELVASAARALNTDVDVPLALVMWTGRIGEPLYQCQPPTGYSDKAEAWVNTGALLNRLNFLLALAGNRMRGAHANADSLIGMDAATDPRAALDRAIEVLLANQVSDQTRAALTKQLSDPQVLQANLEDPVKEINAGVIAGLVLGVPEFQRK